VGSQVSNFIVAQRLAAKIDRVAGTVETTVLDKRHANYQALIKQGDLLLNRIQKLSKIVDVE
jgi:26S proteasome regulatory subunit N7